MKNKIVSLCKTLEKKEHIKILFAVESGSRLWRMSSKDSDYDVRFVFVQPLENYISIQNDKNTNLVINHTFGDIDLSGFDIFKFSKLLLKSNPSIIEWFQSDILYYGKKPKELQKIALTHFNPAALYYHYKSMCRFNYEKYLASKHEVTYKKYLYAMRGLVNAQYVITTQGLPPISFPECLQRSSFLPTKIKESLLKIIKLKCEGREKDLIQNISLYDQYILEFLQKNEKILPKPIEEKNINKELQNIVLKE
ncbi:nucleotidyltransferase domain-containing protein [Candidatus Woesearchaeota archaeon]|nr:nucleotidyltransferase domain-containing protein [Candidatus Woesearchaeota archaeon]